MVGWGWGRGLSYSALFVVGGVDGYVGFCWCGRGVRGGGMGRGFVFYGSSAASAYDHMRFV